LKSRAGLVYLTAEEMAEADRLTIEEFGIDVLSLMENAGLATAKLARMMLGGSVKGKKLCCLVGKGNNGGDGLVAARHLFNWGAKVNVVIGGDRSELRDVPARQLTTVDRMQIPVSGPEGDFGAAALLVDSLLGYGSRGNPREPVAGLICRANDSRIPILAVDIPSGFDATSGEPGEPCITAKATVTFGLPKTGFLNPRGRKFLGDIYLADISLPVGVYGRFSQPSGLFRNDSLVELTR